MGKQATHGKSGTFRGLCLVFACLAFAGCRPDWSRADDGAVVGCGNGIREGSEQCDGADLGGSTCQGQGFQGGQLGCDDNCNFDTTGCIGCGNGVIDGDDVCDDGNRNDGDGCSAACEEEPGYRCRFEPSQCTLLAGCDDGVCDFPNEDHTTCPADCAWVYLTAGDTHTCGVKADGTLFCWGSNEDGELGTGVAGTDQTVPTQAATTPAAEAAAGGDPGPGHSGYTCALLPDETVRCWGANNHDQLGTDGADSTVTPTEVPDLSGVSVISAGKRHACAVAASNTAYCWGEGSDGKLGDGTGANQPLPSQVDQSTGLVGVQDIAAGSAHTCAIDLNATLWCWGKGDRGQLGNNASGTGYQENSPVQVLNLTGVSKVAVGNSHTCATVDPGQVYCFGKNDDGELGDGTAVDGLVPVPVLNLGNNAIGLAAGDDYSCALTATGEVWCWGKGDDGRLGDGTGLDSLVPVQVVNLSDARVIEGGKKHVCALTGAGSAWCWGDGGRGQLGDNDIVDRLSPVEAVDPF